MARRTIYRSTEQKLTDGMRVFLERQPFAVLATYNPDGSNVTIAITPRRWSAWDIRSTFFAALRDAGIPLDGAESWFQT